MVKGEVEMKIAVASDNWINVERNLEEDGQFIILRNTKGKLDFDSVRMMRWGEDEIFSLLADCSVILCRHVKKRTKESIENNGIKVIATHGTIIEIINDYLNFSMLESITNQKYKESKLVIKANKVRQ